MTAVSYAPGILVRGDSFDLNFQPGRVILNAKDAAGRSTQCVSTLTDSEYSSVKRVVEQLQPQ